MTVAINPKTPIASQPTEGEVLIKRTFDAPRELVFQAWSDPAHLARWYAPHGCTIEFRQLDFRTGGTFLTCIWPPEGPPCWCSGKYLEIVRPERIVFSVGLCDEQGRPVESAEAGKQSDWPRETIVTVTFAGRAGGTLLTLHQNVAEAIAKQTGAYPSWLQMLDRLAAELMSA